MRPIDHQAQPLRHTRRVFHLGLLQRALVLAAGFAVVAAAVVTAGALTAELDLLRAAQVRRGLMADVARLVDATTGYAGVATASAAAVAVLLVAHRPVTAVRLTVAVAGAAAGTSLLKQAVERPRPELLSSMADVSQFSFPSGHAAATAALAVAAALASRGSRCAGVVVGVGVVAVVATAAAQLVLVRHHPTDLVGGWLWAAAWTAAVWAVQPRGDAP